MMGLLDTLISEAQDKRLPSLPVVGLKILEAVKGEDFSADQLTDIISTDPALSLRILKMANSPLYCQVSEVASIDRAVVLLGARTLKNLALSFVIIGEMKAQASNGFDYEQFWKKSVTEAVAAEIFSTEVNRRSDDTYISALLMNLGKFIMYTCKPEEYLEACNEHRITGVDIVDIEQKVFGFDHQRVSREILERWNIPKSIYDPIMYHHNIEDCPAEISEQADILKVASLISYIYNLDRSVEMLDRLYVKLKTNYGYDTDKVNKLIDDVALRTMDMLAIYNIASGEMRPYSELIEEANAELSSMCISYEHMVRDLKESKARTDLFAQELMAAISKIKTLSGLLPICSNCKKIRDEGSTWVQIESYIREHSSAEFTHSYCPACSKELLQSLKKKRNE